MQTPVAWPVDVDEPERGHLTEPQDREPGAAAGMLSCRERQDTDRNTRAAGAHLREVAQLATGHLRPAPASIPQTARLALGKEPAGQTGEGAERRGGEPRREHAEQRQQRRRHHVREHQGGDPFLEKGAAGGAAGRGRPS